MAYRSEQDAERERQRALTAQIAEMELRLAQRSMLVAHKKRVEAQLLDVDQAASKRRAKVPLPLLSRIRVASPCHERWDLMTGDERVRHCASCDKDVYDLSEMTAAEAEDLLANVGEAACVRLHRRADGTVITSDCPVGAKRKRRNRWLAAGAAAAGSAMAAAGALLVPAAAEQGGIACAIEPPPDRYGSSNEVSPPNHVEEDEIEPTPYIAHPRAGGIRFVPEPREDVVEAPPPEEAEEPTGR